MSEQSGQEPVCAFGPASPIMDSWRSREPRPLVVLRCGRGKRKCRRALVEVYDSNRGALVRFFKSWPDAPIRGTDDALDLLARREAEQPGGIKASGDGTALMRGQTDSAGWLVALEDQSYWHNVVRPGCRQHGMADLLSRATLMDWVRRARRGENVTGATV